MMLMHSQRKQKKNSVNRPEINKPIEKDSAKHAKESDKEKKIFYHRINLIVIKMY